MVGEAHEAPEPHAEDQSQRPKGAAPSAKRMKQLLAAANKAASAARLAPVEGLPPPPPPADPTHAKPLSALGAYESRHRRIRVKVGSRPLVLREGCSLSSAVIGELLPGTVMTVVEERRVASGQRRGADDGSADEGGKGLHVRGRVALDHLSKARMLACGVDM